MVGSGLAQMDIETFEAIEGLRTDIRRVETTLGARIDRFDLRLDGEIRELAGGMGQMRDQLREEIRTTRDELRRHFDIIAESLRDDIRMIAEGVIALDGKVETLRRS